MSYLSLPALAELAAVVDVMALLVAPWLVALARGRPMIAAPSRSL